MVTLTKKPVCGTSFHGTTITTTTMNLLRTIGIPQISQNTGEDRINFEWYCETDSGDVFTIYDWKEYRTLNLYEQIEFHIGGFSKKITEAALNELTKIVNI